MNCHRIRKLQLVQHGKLVLYDAILIKHNSHSVVFSVNAFDISHVTVEYSLPFRKIASLSPADLIVVFNLHHLIAYPENPLSESLLVLFF